MKTEIMNSEQFIHLKSDDQACMEWLEKWMEMKISVFITGDVLVKHPSLDKDMPFRQIPVLMPDGRMFLSVYLIEDEAAKASSVFYPKPLEVLLKQTIFNQRCDGLMIYAFDEKLMVTKSMMQHVLEDRWDDEPSDFDLQYRFTNAVHFAAEHHLGQCRKGTSKPYLVHPMEVVSILQSMNGDTNLLAAAVLHDVVEDGDVSVTEIVRRFGPDVAALVAGHSENKSLSWEQRKSGNIKDARLGSRRLRMMIMADVTANQRSMLQDYRRIGEKLWDRFNASKAEEEWYYGEVQDALFDMQYDPNTRWIYWEMVNTYKDLFIHFFLDVEKNLVYQINDQGKGHVFSRDTADFSQIETDAEPTDFEITREFAETIEDAWALSPEEKRKWKEWLFSDVEDPTSHEIAEMVIQTLKRTNVIKTADEK